MKVIFQSRKTLFSVPGGDTIQVEKTKKNLERLGVLVCINNDLDPDLSDFDLVHIFNLIRPQEVLTQIRNAKRQNKKVVLSTIYVDYREYEAKARSGILKLLNKFLTHGQTEYLKVIARAVKNREIHNGTWNYLCKGHDASLREIIALCDVLLPNSESEMSRVEQDFPEALKKARVIVPNAVDTDLFQHALVTLTTDIEPYRNCVLCVARIEGIKNQLNLVRAMNGLPMKLVLLGNPAPNHLSYYEQIKKEAGPNVHILSQIDHSLLPQYYKAAKVHCLVSWMETTGLSSLEAGAMGCNLVITDKGDTRDYFGDYAFYCEPDSIESIRSAVIKAYEAPENPALREHILNNFIWEKTAEKTLEGYKLALST